MSEEENTGNTPEAAEAADTSGEGRWKNLQAETQRKMENLRTEFSESNQKMEQTLQTILANIQTRQGAGKSTDVQEKKLSELLYDNPEQAVATIEDRVASRVSNQMANQQSIQQTAAQLESDFPEFRDRTSEHYKRVEAHYKQLPQAMWNTKQGLELAAMKAATELGLIPASKRKGAGNDDYSVSSGSGSSGSNRGTSKKKNEANASQVEFASLLGAPINDPKFKELLNKATNRKTWSKYRTDSED